MTDQTHELYKGFEVTTGQYLNYEDCIFYEIRKNGVLAFDTMWLDMYFWKTHEEAYEQAKRDIDERGHLGADPTKWMQSKEIGL